MSFRGNYPEWEPPLMPPFGFPFGMNQDYFFHLYEGLQLVKADAEKALAQNQYVTALGLYSDAIEMLNRNPPLREDLPKMLCNRSLVLTKMQKYPGALADARNCIQSFPYWIKAYWRAAQAFKGMSLQYEALRYLLQGINMCIQQGSPSDDHVSFLTEIVITIPQVADDPEDLLEHAPVPKSDSDVLMKVLQKLCRDGHWDGVSLLVLGIHNGPISDWDAVARNCPMQSLSVGSLINNIKTNEMKKYGVKLAITMLKNGATCEDLEYKTGCPAVHVGIKVALETDMVDLLKHLLSTYVTTQEKKDVRDQNGDTGYHRLVKSGKINTQIGETILHLLKNYECNPTLKDRFGKSPIQYLRNSDIAYKMLNVAEKNAVQKLEKEMNALKEDGNKAYKEQNYKKALELYSHALDLLLNNFQDCSKEFEAAILYKNRSMVYSDLDKNELALDDAVESVKVCPTWYKGHWRRGQVLRSIGQHREAYSAFLEGFRKSEDITEDKKCDFLMEAAISFSNVSDETLMQSCYKGFEGVPFEFWPTVLSKLSKKGEWIAIRYLVLGLTDSDNGVARYANSREVDFSKLFPFLYKQKNSVHTHEWLTNLVAILLHNGNNLLSFTEDDKDTPVHAAVKFSLCTGNTKILDDMPKVDGINMIDKHGDSPFHVITKRRPTSDIKSMMMVAQVLIQKGFSLDILDSDGRRAVEYINPGQHKQLYDMLIKMTKPPSVKPLQFQTSNFSEYPAENLDIQELKNKGNAEFQNGNFQEALRLYTLAIDVGLRLKKGGHELAVLFSNRAECYLKLGQNTQALDDALESVSHDGHWYKGHLRVGRVQNAMCEYEAAAKAFANANNALEKTKSQNIQLEIVSEFASVYVKLDQKKYNRNLKAKFLNNTNGEIWARVSYDLICKKQENPAEFAYQQLHFQDKVTSRIVMDLKPLCDVFKEERWNWMIDLVHLFVAWGSDHKTIVFSPGERYIHSVVRMTLAAGNLVLLNYVMEKIACPNREQDLIDNQGNTALHVATRDSLANLELRYIVISILLEFGANPVIKNHNGVLPYKYLPDFDLNSIGIMLQHMSFREEMDREMKRKKKQERQAQEQERKQQEQRRIEEDKKRRQEQQKRQQEKEQQKKQTTRQNNSGQQSGLDHSAKQCQNQNCEGVYLESVDNIQNESKRLMYIYSDLVHVLKQKHKGDKHTEICKKIVTLLIESIGNTLNPEIPLGLVKIKEKLFYNILDGLAANEKWRQMVTLVQKHRSHHGEYSLRDFAKKVNIPKVITHSSFRGSEPLLVEIIENMLESGAVLEKDGKLAVLAAIQEEHFKVLAEILKRGANPDFLMLTVGDTPVHAALSIALERDKGNFSILNMLLDLFEKDPQNYPSLNPQQQDANGDGLFHLLARVKYNSITQKATELLCNKKVSSAISNNENKLPYQYLSKNDRRLQFFRLAAVNADPKPITTKKSKNKSSASKTSLEIPKTEEGSKTVSVTEEMEVSEPEEVVKPKEPVKMYEVAQKKDGIKSVSKKDAVKRRLEDMIFNLPETPYSIFAVKKQRGEELNFTPTVREVSAEPEKTQTPKVKVEGNVNIEEEKKESEVMDDVKCKEAVEESDEEDDEISDENFQMDIQVFDNLEWEVECTADVWKTLHDSKVIPELRRRVVRKVQLLASGEWRPHLCKKLNYDGPDTLKLFEAKLSKGSRIIWELAVAFSPRLSETAERRLQVDEKGEERSSVKGGRIYSEVIRVWDITFDHDKISRTIQKIIKSHNRGETCMIQKKLKGIKQTQFQAGANKRLPMIYAETDLEMNTETLKEYQQELQQYFPPASANETEYHILKFYSFSSNLVSHILQNIEVKVDFPFRVTDLEHAIINLQSNAPILLLGRSGTGKTTCCLYRLWSQFLSYWSKAKDADAPLLPRCLQFVPQGAPEEEGDSEEQEEEIKVDDEKINEMITEEYLNRNLNEAIASGSCNPSGLEENLERDMEDDNEDTANNGPIYDHLHQVFITKNAILCTELQKNFRELSHACDIAAHHVAMEDQVLPNRLHDVVDFQFPLFVTSRQLLLMLDASLDPPYFFARNDDGSLKVDIQGWSDDGPLSILPFLDDDSDVEDEEEQGQFDDVMDDIDDNITILDAPGAIRRNQKSDPRREVTYEVFAEEVWPRINKTFSKKYHPSLIWTEIMSFIKGSFEALSKTSGYLSRAEYKDLGKKRAPNFSSERDNIYEIFKRYVHFKTQKFFFDETDLVYQVYNRLRTVTNLRWIVHQVFVDETQDFTQAELGLLMRICQNPNQMFLTGDTAQSIMRGIAFRFSDLRSLFFYASQSMQAVGKTSAIEVPKQVYQLTHNYRSHAGILSLASSILELMVEFFPESFDRLEKDQGLFEGPAPVLLESCSFSDLALLLRGNRRKTSHIEFGAHQAILVVNNAARDNIPEELRLGLILTIYEAKGLEFDDILLYNFFKDSQASKEWRVVTEFLEKLAVSRSTTQQHSLVELDENVLQQGGRPRPLTFDPNQHKVLNSELKHLYTAVTRARVNVWIFDQDLEKRAPVFEYFKARKLVRSLSNPDNEQDLATEGMFAEESTPEEWNKRGDDFMKHNLYEVAAKCYNRGGDEHMERVASANQQALLASRIKDNPPRMREEFLHAAVKYLECQMPLKAAICLQNAKEKEFVAHIYEKIGHLERAGETYRKLKRPIQASNCFERLGKYNQAVEILHENDQFDLAIDTLRRYKMLLHDLQRENREIPQVLIENPPRKIHTEERLSYKSAEVYHSYKNESKMMAALGRLPNPNDRFNFLKDKGYFLQASKLLQEEGRHDEAATLLLRHGRTTEAVELARESNNRDIIGRCLLVDATLKFSKQNDLGEVCDTDEIIKSLEEAKELLKNTDKDLLGHVYLLLGQINGKEDDIGLSWGLYNKEWRNEAGQLECMDWMVNNAALSSYLTLRKLVLGMKNLFEVVRALTIHETQIEKSRAEKIFAFYGLHKKNEDMFYLFPKQNPFGVKILKRLLSQYDREDSVQCELLQEKVTVAISRFLLKRGLDWYQTVTKALESLRNRYSQCSFYVSGKWCEVEKCDKMHKPHNNKTYTDLLSFDMLTIELDYYVQKTCLQFVNKIDQDLKGLVGKYLPQDDFGEKFSSCQQLMLDLMPVHIHPKELSDIIQTFVRKFIQIRSVKSQFSDFLRSLNDLLKGEPKDNVKIFVKIIFFSRLLHIEDIDFKKYMATFESNIKRKFSDRYKDSKLVRKNVENLGCMCSFHVDDQTLARELVVQCLPQRFSDAFFYLSTMNNDPCESLIKFTKFVVLLGDRNQMEFLPEVHHFSFWLEIYTTIAFCIAAKLHFVADHKFFFVIPVTYKSALTFVDTSFKDGIPTLEAIKRNHLPRNANIGLIQDRIERMVAVMCGSKVNLNLLWRMFNWKDNMDIKIAERLVILSLVFICNMGKSVWAQSEGILLQSLCKIELNNGDIPHRLVLALQKLKTASGICDIVCILQELLKERGDDLLFCKWDNKRYGVYSELLRKLTYFPSTFINEDTQDMITSPHKCIPLPSNSENETSMVDEDCQLSMEETVRRKKEQEKQQKDEECKNKGIIILRNLKIAVFRRKCKSVEKLVKKQILKEQIEKREKVFDNIVIDDSMCAICGLTFTSQSNEEDVGHPEEMNESPSGGDRSPSINVNLSPQQTKINPFALLLDGVKPIFSETMPPSEKQLHEQSADHSHSEATPPSEKQLHEQSADHYQKMMELRSFKSLYNKDIAPALEGASCFISRYYIESDKASLYYSAMTLDITNFLDCKKKVEEELQRILTKKDWSSCRGIMMTSKEMVGHQNALKEYVQNQYKRLQLGKKSRKNEAVESSKNNYVDDEDDNPEPVVEEPNLNKLDRGKARGRARERARRK